jgi:hypothetical protein
MNYLKRAVLKILDKLIFPEKLWHIRGNIYAGELVRAIKSGLSDQAGVKIAVFNHFLDQDLEAMRYAIKQGAAADISVIPIAPIYAWARQYFPESATEFTGYLNPKISAAKLAFRARLIKTLMQLKKSIPRLIFLAPADQFFWVREFVLACQEVGYPFIVLDKEGTRSDEYFEIHTEEIKRYMPPIADYFLVWSQRQLKFHVLSGCDRKRVFIVGQPRSDFWAHKERWQEKNELFKQLGIDSTKKTILYFDFENNNYLHDKYFRQGFNWDSLLEDVHQELLAIAKANPSINVLFKLHPQAQNIEQVRAAICVRDLPNVHLLTGSGLSNDLIVNSDLIIAFQTTALLDAMLTKKPIIYIWWRNAPEFKEHLLQYDENEGVEVANSRDDFRRRIETHIKNNLDQEIPPMLFAERRKLTDVFFYQPDGHVGERVIAKIAELAESYYHER